MKEFDKNTKDDAAWADFLSGAAQLEARDEQSTNHVLAALKLERTGNTDAAWNTYLSKAAELRPVDLGAVQPALNAVQLERKKHRILKLNITRAVAGFAAAAVAAVAFVVLSPPSSADSSEVYSLYQEASTGW